MIMQKNLISFLLLLLSQYIQPRKFMFFQLTVVQPMHTQPERILRSKTNKQHILQCILISGTPLISKCLTLILKSAQARCERQCSLAKSCIWVESRESLCSREPEILKRSWFQNYSQMYLSENPPVWQECSKS